MQRRTRVLFCAVLGLIALASFTIGCGSSSNAKIRLVNATPDENSLDLLVDTKNVASGVGYGAASAYASVASGTRQLQVEPTGSTSVLLETSPSIGSGNKPHLWSRSISPSTSAAFCSLTTTPRPLRATSSCASSMRRREWARRMST